MQDCDLLWHEEVLYVFNKEALLFIISSNLHKITYKNCLKLLLTHNNDISINLYYIIIIPEKSHLAFQKYDINKKHIKNISLMCHLIL